MRGPTTDHASIREWARAHQATPAELEEHIFDGAPVRLRFVFGEFDELAKKEVHPISWDQFFAMFELLGLALAFDGGQQYEILELQKQPQTHFEDVRH